MITVAEYEWDYEALGSNMGLERHVSEGPHEHHGFKMASAPEMQNPDTAVQIMWEACIRPLQEYIAMFGGNKLFPVKNVRKYRPG